MALSRPRGAVAPPGDVGAPPRDVGAVLGPDARCVRCGASLAGLETYESCRTCGLVARETLARGRGDLVDQDGQVIADSYCRRCGYNLRGLHVGGLCPECGFPVERSARPDFICFAEPRWVRRTARGAMLVGVGLGMTPFALVSLFVVRVSGTALGPQGAMVLRLVLLLAALLGMLIIPLGAWQITAREPARPVALEGAGRGQVRMGLIAAVAFVLIAVVVDKLWPRWAPIVLAVLVLPLGVMGVVGVAAYFRYAASLAARLPDDWLVRTGRFLYVWFSVCLGAWVLLWFARWAILVASSGAGAAGGPMRLIGGCGSSLVALGLFGGLVMALVFQVGLAGGLRAEARRAAALWRP